MTKYEYKVTSATVLSLYPDPNFLELEDVRHKRRDEQLSELGKDGWLLCGIFGDQVIFARPIGSKTTES